ncbi:DUF6445 family protein [Sphingomonas sp. SUN019]|uniref:DUF6445 family protein n=1 Tax=Sphingomonas sp. SUN019 TaxID=2937788 RepID=UPI0021645144|nr:DUF6445 family protein [Sphingomonas sp. SUN019]UVO49531.1 DUF6445 family protein [Sphingomonas sp. SUN019]
MKRPEIVARRIGREQQPIAIIDDFAPDPDALRAFAIGAEFGPGREHYPGIRATLPDRYLAEQQALIATVLREIFGHATSAKMLDASFSIVTRAPEELSLEQRLPHVDAVEAGRIAMVHYLSPDSADGTAFFRHRATGFETIDAARAGIYYPHLDAELRNGAMPAGYIADDTSLFERIHHVDARYNRAVLYRSAALHSGAIREPAALSADPAVGRLTVTAFLAAT